MIFSDYVGEAGSVFIRTSKKAMEADITGKMTDRTWINDEGEEEVVFKMTGIGIHGLENIEINMDILLYAATREQADKLYELIDACDIVWNRDSTVTSIVEEELGPFFAGDRTARETAEMIQNRVSIYVAEQSR